MSPQPAFVAALARVLARSPGRVVTVALLLAVAAGVLASCRLGLTADRVALIGEEHAFNRRFRELQAEFGDLDSLVVVVRGPGREAARAYAGELAAALERDPAHFSGLFWKVPEEALAGRALLFLPLPELEQVAGRLEQAGGGLQALFQRGLAGLLREAAAGADQPPPTTRDGAEAGLTFLEQLVGDAREALQGGGDYRPPWAALVPAGQDELDGHVWTGDGRLVLLVRVQGRLEGDLAASEGAVDALRALVERVRASHPEVTIGVTGGPTLEVDEMRTYRRDAALATSAALVGVTALALVAFWRLLGPLLVLITLSLAVVHTLGFAAIWPGQLNLISGVFCALLVGLGVDYGIHLIARFDEERSGNRNPEEALAVALRRAGRAVAAGAFTTALAFLATVFTELQGIREFGVVAGVGILVCLVESLVVLPALVVLADRAGRRPGRPRGGWASTRPARFLDRLHERHPGLLVALGLGLTALALLYLGGVLPPGPPRVRYDGNLLTLQAQGLESVELAGEVLGDPSLGGMFGAIVVEDLERLELIETAVRALPRVAGTQSLLGVVPSHQEEKRALLAGLAQVLEREGLPPANGPGPKDLADLAPAAGALSASLDRLAQGALVQGEGEGAERLLALAASCEALEREVRAAGPAGQERLLRWQGRVLDDLAAALGRLRQECHPGPVLARDLPEAIRSHFVGRHGKLLLRVYPRGNPWDARERAEFLEELRGLVPDVGGLPVQFQESDLLLQRGYRKAAVIAAAFVAILLVIHFRGLLTPLVAMITLGAGLTWALAALALLGLDLNPANLIALPLTVGIGIDSVIHLAQRHNESRATPSVAAPLPVLATGTGRAVLLSAATTLVSFGALAALSHHRGIASVGWATCLGVVACLASSVLLCPPALRLTGGAARRVMLLGWPGPKTGPGGGPRPHGQEDDLGGR